MTVNKGRCFCGAIEIEVHGAPEAMGLLPLQFVPILVGVTRERLHLVEAAERRNHKRCGVSIPVHENRGERSPVLQAMRRSSDDRPSAAGFGGRLCGHDTDPEVQPWCPCQLRRDGAADEGRATETKGLSRRARRFWRARAGVAPTRGDSSLARPINTKPVEEKIYGYCDVPNDTGAIQGALPKGCQGRVSHLEGQGYCRRIRRDLQGRDRTRTRARGYPPEGRWHRPGALLGRHAA